MASIQKRIIEAFEKEIGERESIAKWFEYTFNIDASTARRKLVGESKITLEQLALMVQEKPALLEVLLPQPLRSNTFLGAFNQIRNFQNIDSYLRALINSFKLVDSESVLNYVARDLPLFFFLANRDLASFKFSLWTGELLKGKVQRLSNKSYALCQEVYQLYCSLPSIEIWNRQIMANQHQQLNWHSQMKHIDAAQKNDLLAVFRHQLLEYKDWSVQGSKNKEGSLELYFSEYITMNNGGLLQSGPLKVLMSSISNVNFISTLNPVLCESFHKEFQAQMNASTLVSRSNALERERSFNPLLAALQV